MKEEMDRDTSKCVTHQHSHGNRQTAGHSCQLRKRLLHRGLDVKLGTQADEVLSRGPAFSFGNLETKAGGQRIK